MKGIRILPYHAIEFIITYIFTIMMPWSLSMVLGSVDTLMYAIVAI